MAQIIFPHQIKYKGLYIEANNAFEVDDGDKKQLVKMGGKIVGDEKIASNKTAPKR